VVFFVILEPGEISLDDKDDIVLQQSIIADIDKLNGDVTFCLDNIFDEYLFSGNAIIGKVDSKQIKLNGL
jgi:hypothetical protein